MSLFLSARSLKAPADLPGVLELFRMAAVTGVAFEDGPLLGPDDRARLRGFAVLAHGVFLPSEDPFAPNLAAGDEDFRRRSVRRLEAHLAFCADQGIARYTFMPGDALAETFDPAVPSPPGDRLRARDQLLRSLDRLATVADSLGVGLGLMNGDARRPEMLGCDAPELTWVLDALQVPFLGLRLDVANMLLSARRRAFAVEEFVAQVSDRLVGLRLHEVTKEGRAHKLPVPDGPTEELLAAHPAWHELPITLDARGVSLDRLLDTRERLESKLAPLEHLARPAK